MPLAARPRSTRLLVLTAVSAALVPVLVAGPAAAEDPAVPGEVTAGDTVVGELVRAFADPEHAGPGSAHAAGHPDDALLSFVDTPGEGSVRVPTEDVATLQAGATVEVTVGGEVRDEATVEQGLAPAREVVEAQVVAPAEAAATTAPHTNAVTVVLVQPAGAPRDGTVLADVVAAVDGPVRDYWQEQSNGAVTVAVTAAHDWITTTAGCADPLALWEEVAARPSVDWAGAPGEHLLLHVPGGTPGCGYGLGTIGSGVGDGGLAYVQDTATSVIAHELGHNFGLGHSSAVQCDASPEAAPCRTVEYWDFYDVMGISWEQVGSLNAPHAARLGVLPPSASRTVTASGTGGTHTLSPMGSRSGVRVLSLTAGSTRYWIEYRAAVGQDSWLSDPWASYGLEPGVLVHADGPGPLGDTSLLLDGTPSSSAGWDVDEQTVLPSGGRMTVGGFTVTVGLVSSTGATVTVRTPAEGPGSESAIGARYRQLGGPSGRLGAPVGVERCGLRGGGCLQHFEGGSLYWSPATGARLVDGEIFDRWGALGWEIGRYGYPVADAVCGLRDGGCLQLFQGGSIYWTPFTGARAVDGAIRDRWGALNWEIGYFGYPVADARCGLRDGGCLQLFQGGSIYWTPFTGARAVDGDIRTRWGQLGWELGRYGYPTSDAVCARDLVCAQDFQGGSIFWTPSTGARAVDGEIRDRWGRLGALGGRYGPPVSDARCGLRGGGCLQQFRGGWIYWSPATGARAIDGDIRTRWGQLGWEAGPYGYPITDARCGLTGGACVQEFQGGTIYWTPAYGARAMDGAIRERWWPMMGSGTNYPVSDARCGLRNGGCLQQFEQTTIYWSPATGAHPVHGVIRDRWAAQGWENGRLGYPVHNETCELFSGGCARLAQRFQGGTITVP